MNKILPLGLFGLALTACTHQPGESRPPSAGQPCQRPDESQVAALFERWNDALQTGQPAQVVDLYAKDSVLLPTLSSTMRLTAAEKEDYFQHFLALDPEGRIDQRRIYTGCNQAVDVGHYTFTLGDGRQVPARYTFTYAWDGQEWLISSHHSSARPMPNPSQTQP